MLNEVNIGFAGVDEMGVGNFTASACGRFFVSEQSEQGSDKLQILIPFEERCLIITA